MNMNTTKNATALLYTTQAIAPDILSVLDVAADGKVVSAQTWRQLWQLVFQHINKIDEFCLEIDSLRVSYETTRLALEAEIAKTQTKYEALKTSFIHYGSNPPDNEHVKLWVKRVNDIYDNLVITKAQLDTALATKVDQATSAGAILNIELSSYVSESPTFSHTDRYYADVDITTISAGIGGDRRTVTAYTIPAGTNITVTHTRGLGAYDGSEVRYVMRVIVTTDTPWLVAVDNAGTTIAKVVNIGQFEVLADVVNGVVDLSTIRTQFYRAANVDPVRKNIVVKLPKSGWSKETISKPYSQVITTLTGVTINSRIDPTPEPETLASWIANGYVFMTANNNTVVRAYSVGKLPDEDIYMPITITEVSN